jgi:hypothetical protein
VTSATPRGVRAAAAHAVGGQAGQQPRRNRSPGSSEHDVVERLALGFFIAAIIV